MSEKLVKRIDNYVKDIKLKRIQTREQAFREERSIFEDLTTELNELLGFPKGQEPLQVWGSIHHQNSYFLVAEFNGQGRCYGTIEDQKFLKDTFLLGLFYKENYINKEITADYSQLWK